LNNIIEIIGENNSVAEIRSNNVCTTAAGLLGKIGDKERPIWSIINSVKSCMDNLNIDSRTLKWFNHVLKTNKALMNKEEVMEPNYS